MNDAAVHTHTRTTLNGHATSSSNDDAALLYTLDFACPFPWPQLPNYPASSNAAAVTAGNSKSNAADSLHDSAMDETHAPTASTSKVRAEPMQAGDRLLLEDSNHDAGDAGDASAVVEEVQYPDTLQEYYWDCLYCSSKSAKNESATRLVKAFRSEHYKTTILHTDGTQEIHQSYRDTLSSILYTQLGKLDKKYHVDLPMIMDDWTRAHEYLENGTLADEDGDNASKQVAISHDAIPKAEAIDSVKAEYQSEELVILKRSWEEWVKSAKENEGEKILSASERRNRLRSTIRERLSALETAELQLQILVALELLCVLPIPSYLTSRSAHHRRMHSSSATHPQNWLAILRAGTPQRGSSGSRKRKKDSSVELSTLPSNGPITSSNLTTPRQSGSSHYPSTLTHHHIETIAEDEQDEIVVQRSKLEKLFKETARLLDSQTDNLAIQQTVSNAIGSLSLSDLMNDSLHGHSENGDVKEKEKEELDGFQSFWLEVVEEHYASRLPSDILSGCQSKFYSNSLDPSLSHSLQSSMSTSHPSPFHHPTPNLRQLARSVHLANLQAEKDAIPQSPTLVKLLAAKEELPPKRAAVPTEDVDFENLINGTDNVDWLMPAPAPVSFAGGVEAPKSDLRKDKINIKRAIKKGGNNTLSTIGFSNMKSTSIMTNNNNNNLKHHHTRVVEFGKIQQVKEKREEIQKKMLSSIRQSSSSQPFKPFNSSSSLVSAHLQSQQNNSSSSDLVGSSSSLGNGRGSLMGNSLGARAVNSSVNASTEAVSHLPSDENDNNHNASSTSSLSTNTLFNANHTNGRISKRKAASPKKTTVSVRNGSSNGSNTSRTLVLATPVKLRTKSSFASSSVSTSALFDGNVSRAFPNKHKIPGQQQQTDIRSRNTRVSLSKSGSLPVFKWGLPELGRGIDEVDEEDMDRGFGLDENSDEDNDEEGQGKREKPSRGMLLVGETPEKG